MTDRFIHFDLDELPDNPYLPKKYTEQLKKDLDQVKEQLVDLKKIYQFGWMRKNEKSS